MNLREVNRIFLVYLFISSTSTTTSSSSSSSSSSTRSSTPSSSGSSSNSSSSSSSSSNLLLTVLRFYPCSYLYIMVICHTALPSFQPVLHDWCNKYRGMCYPVCWMVHIKEPLLLIGKSSPCGSNGFPLSLSEWSFTICPTPYNRN